MDVEQRYSLMFSDLDYQEHDWAIAPAGPVTKGCALQLTAAPTAPAVANSPTDSKVDNVWYLLEDMDLPRSMLLAGDSGMLRTPQGGGVAGAKRKLPFDDELLAVSDSLLLIGPETFAKETSSPCVSPVNQ